MKTKISHLGRSTVSVILAVMMLLSTMLVGTVSNVEALTSTDTVYFVDKSGSWSSVNAYIWNDDGDLGAWPGSQMQNTGSVTSDGKIIFSYPNKNLSSKDKIIFNNGSSQTANLALNLGKLYCRTSANSGVWKNIYQFSVASDLPSGCTSATLKNGSLAYEGDTVTVTVKVSSGYSCTGLQGVADASVTKSDDNTYSITFKATKDLENITPIVGEAKNLNLKVAVVKYADVSSKDSNDSDKLSNLNVTYTSSNGSQSTTTMTRDADDAKVYFKPSKAWKKVVEFYLYDLVLPEGTTKFKLNKGNEVTISDDVDYYAIYHYGGFKNESFTESDRYYTATVTADTSVATGATASFTASPAGAGFNDDSSVVMYKCNTALTLSKSFDTEKYNFTKWSDGTTDFTEDSYTVKGDTALTAYFEKKESYKVTVDSTTGGSVTVDKADFSPNQTVTITVNKNDGYELDSLSVIKESDSSSVDYTKSSDTSYTFPMPSDNVKVTAKFVAIDYTVSYTADGDGYTVTNVSPTTANVGDKITFKVSAKTGYEIKSVTADNATVTNEDGTYTFTMPAKDVAITVNASLVQYEIAKTGSDELTYKVGDDTVTTAAMGQKVTVSATKTGYTLTSISVVDENGETVEVEGLAFTMPASKVTVTPTFTANSYDITVTENENCTITVDNDAKSAVYGSTVKVTVTPKDGYKVNGINVTNVNADDITGNEAEGYTFNMPASDVEITPNVEAVEVTAPKVTLNGLSGTSLSVKVKQSNEITAFAEAGDAYSQITSTVFSVSGGVEGTDYIKTETFEGSGIYNFVALTKGTFTVTYTATATSKNDDSKKTEATATLTITASYTPTQQAYVDLENYVNTVKDTSADSYTEDSYKDFSTALKSAQDLLTGLPNADATNTDVYTTALTNLQNAYKNLKSNKQYYILGHSAITGRTDDTSSATTHDNGVPMKDNGNGDYTYTFSSPDIKSGNDAFCFIDNNDKTYKTNSADSINITQYTAKNPYTVDITSADKGLYYIGNPTASKRYTIHLNTATDGKIKVWVEEPPLTYGLQGEVYASQSDSNFIGWSNYSETMSFNADNNYTLKFYAKKTNATENQFRLIDSAKTDYGSNIQSGLKVNLNTYYTTTKSNGYTYHVDYSDKPYTITLKNPGENPPTFKVTQGTQYSVTVDSNIENGKISVDNAKPYEGDTVTVTATPDSDYVLDTVTFNGESANVVGNKATFTMPNENVTVTATFRKANKYKVTIASDITNGTVTANGSSKTITVTEGAPVTLVAVPDSSYSFSSWSITPENGYTPEGSMTSATATIYPTADITVSASFAQGTASADHFLAWGESDSIGDWIVGTNTYSSTDENGKKIYTTYLDTSLFKENTWYRFAVTKKIPSSNDRLNSGDLHYNTSDITVNNYPGYHEGDNVKTERKENSGNYFGMFQYSGELVSLSISYNEGTKNYQVTPVVKVHNGAKLYAKDGAYRTEDFSAGMNKGKTSISYDAEKYEIDVDTKSSSLWQIAYLSEDNIKDEVKLTITTKVTDSEYYLAGWCVDGETYLPKTSNTKSNEYSFDYYVKSTTKLTDTIEVTPVYFYQASADVETVRFYVTGFDDTVKKDWGNTIAIYPYYSGTGGDVFSKYPGQPMLMSGGRYYVDLPITYNGGTIAGVTLNNFYYDAVHMGLVSSLGNRQTYDYNDFLKIYEQKISGSTERKSQEIIFSFKYVPSGESGYNNFGDDSTNKGNKTSVTYPDTISAEDMETLYANGWEDLTDFYGNKVDLYDQKVDASSVAGKKNPWRVISNGYEQTYFGYYATRWAVYKPNVETGNVTSYSLVDVISSSSLLYNNYEAISTDTTKYSAGDDTLSASSDAKAYKAFKDAGADGVPVKITYEQTIERGKSIENGPSNRTENAFRNDGRWYYSEDNLNVTAHTVIEYAETVDDFSGTLGTNFFRDYYQDGKVDYTKDGYDNSQYTGLTTGTSAYFTNDEYYKKTEANGQTGSGNTFDIIANTDHASQYIFVGWYLLSEGKYSPLTATVENSVSVPQDNNDVYVARFIKAPSGSLTISHKLHPNTTGLGKCYVSVDVLDKIGKVIHSYDETTSDITVSNAYITYGQGNKIKITLRTVPGEATTFNDFYSYSKEFSRLVDTAEPDAVPSVTVTNDPTNDTYKAEISFNVDDYLFDKDSTDLHQSIKVLNYFSKLSLGSVKYEIKYTFNTRLYGTKVYKVSGTLTADDITNYGCTEAQLSKPFVMAKAPFESNFKQNITWDSDKITFGSKADGTLTADITATQVDDRNVTATFYVNSDSSAETITTDFGNRFFKKDGSYISAEATGATYYVEGLPDAYKNTEGNFSFWYVMTKDKEFVTKAYGEKFAYTGYDNYIVVAVYGVEGSHKDTATNSSINFLQYSRNHWNDTVTGKNDTGSYSLAGTEYDRLYADFNLMFNHNGLLLNNYSGNDIKVGYAMVVGSKTDGNYTVKEEELKTAIFYNATNGGNVEHQSTSATAKKAVTVTGSDNDGAKKNVIVNSIRIADLDNKNRITSYYGFKNSEANQSYYVKVYSYVIVGNEVTLSETPVVINLNDIGNKTYVPQQ